jgi:hypothetical protein
VVTIVVTCISAGSGSTSYYVPQDHMPSTRNPKRPKVRREKVASIILTRLLDPHRALE